MGDTKILNIAEHSRAQSIQSTRAEPQGTKEHSSEHRRKHGREHGREQSRKSRAERATNASLAKGSLDSSAAARNTTAARLARAAAALAER